MCSGFLPESRRFTVPKQRVDKQYSSGQSALNPLKRTITKAPSYCLLSRVVHTTLVLSLEFFQPFFGYYFFNTLLLVLQALHIFWAYLILRMLYKFVFLGKVRGLQIKREGCCELPSLRGNSILLVFLSSQVERDERSEDESEVDDEEEAPEEDGDEGSRKQRKGAINCKLASLANNCVLNNLTSQRKINCRAQSRKAR